MAVPQGSRSRPPAHKWPGTPDELRGNGSEDGAYHVKAHLPTGPVTLLDGVGPHQSHLALLSSVRHDLASI